MRYLFVLLLLTGCNAEPVGRYQMSAGTAGMYRIDTKTGAIERCVTSEWELEVLLRTQPKLVLVDCGVSHEEEQRRAASAGAELIEWVKKKNAHR